VTGGVPWRRFVGCAGAVAVAGVVHVVLGRALAGSDPVGHRNPLVVAAIVALLLARVFLVFLAPPWIVYVAVRTLASRPPSGVPRARARRPTVGARGGGDLRG
jgi:hypothetical protein